ncbi:cell growth-regulating nucleolar protein-like [Phlebotomus argentipes]|uniref:cell growth-regulating nucleolar protein-like n=1 Tax=Phlebotomus argentipes TaxID=94469 RepID=UPI00289302FE|nr:cell growth-regulating nucleolar protein-like [Phlebotomus argentipes]
MVFFTCNHCGESLKKQAVEKHYAWKKCQGAPVFLTCVDCLKDFRGQEYVGHTKCISEAERYYGKDFREKPSQNKGQKKQEAWTDIIQNVLQRDDLSTRIQAVLQMLTKHENVPRKKVKFLNFMKNVSRQTSEYDATRIFDLIEEEYLKNKKEESNSVPEETNGHVNGQEENKKGKKRKKDSVLNGNSEESAENNGLETLDATEEEQKQKKKQKRNSGENKDLEALELKEEEQEKPKKKRKKTEKVNQPEEETIAETAESPAKRTKTRKEVVQEIKNSAESTEKFPWKETLVAILQKNSNSMNLEKLKKRLLKKHQKMHPENTTIQSAFDLVVQRKLRKMKNISVEDDLVTLQA